MGLGNAVAASDEVLSGVHAGIDSDTYHAGPGISNSGLGDILQSPWHYWSRRFHPDRPPPIEKAGQLEGNLAHCAILEPDEFDKRYIVGPDVRRNTKIWKEFVAEHPGLTAIKPDQYEAAMRQREAVLALPDIRDALSKGHSELSAYWTDDATGVLCKCRPDFTHEADAGVVLIDLKTYSDASPAEFRRQIARKGYHRQAAWYSDGYALASQRRVLAFVFVAVETAWPYAACAVMLDEASLDQGRRVYREALNIYAQCLERDEWPSYSNAIELITLPDYAFGE